MARRGRNRRAENQADFAGPNAEQEAIEKLAAAAARENAKAGHNSGEVPDEVLTRNTLLIKEQLLTLDELLGQVAAARGVLGNRKKVAKKDGCDVDAIMLALKYEKRVKNGGASPVVAEHRQIGRILRILDCPLGTQFRLFDLPGDEGEGGPIAAMDAELQGQHAYSNNEPRENNPFAPGTAEHVDWGLGWNAAQTATARKMGGNGEASAH